MISRLKKLGATGLVGLGLFAGAAGIAAAATNGGGSAPSAATQTDDASDTPRYISSVTVPANGSGNESDEAASLQGLAKITAEQARAAALAAVPGTANKVELENENGSVVYGVEIATSNGTVDVKIDAGNGKVLAQESADPESADDHGTPGTETNDGAEAPANR